MTNAVVRLRPKADAQAVQHGFPWIYDDQLVLDRRTKILPPGSLAVLQDAERRPLGLCAVNPASRIVARILDRDQDAVPDRAWFAERLSTALSLRAKLYAAPFYRLVHAEADGLPGVVVDRFGDLAVLQPNAAWAEARLDALVAAISDVTGVTTVVKNASSRARAREGLDDAAAVLLGQLDRPVPVPMNGAIYMADIAGGQKTGLFYDQRDNHAFAARLAKGGTVLDVFSHVGGFALAALAQEGARRTGVADRFATRRADAFAALGALVEEGKQFDTVICDPPAFAPHRNAVEKALRAYERLARLAAPLVAPGGYLVLCSCSHAIGADRFRAVSLRGVGRAGRAAQVLRMGGAGPDHPEHPALPESGYLKALVLRLPE